MKKSMLTLCLEKKDNTTIIWGEILPILTDLFKSNSRCEARINSSKTETTFVEANTYYSDPANIEDKSFVISDGNFISVKYFKLRQIITFVLPFTADSFKLHNIALLLSRNLKFSNLTIRDYNYSLLGAETSSFNPPQSSVYESPNLDNLRKYYIEGVSAEMWFGESFWQYASCSRKELVACDWLETEEKENGVLYVKAYHKPFDSREPEQLAIQRRLLKLLFNIDENRPHGYEPTGAKPKTFVQKSYTDGQTTIVGDLKEQSE